METLGSRIAELRRNAGLTQETLAEKLGVTPQAVSKWETGSACPDISLLTQLARTLGVSVDELLSGAKKQDTVLVPEAQRRPIDEMMFRIVVDSADGDRVRVNLPMSLVRVGVEMGAGVPQISGNSALKEIDFHKLFELVEQGVLGKIIEVESADGDHVEIYVE